MMRSPYTTTGFFGDPKRTPFFKYFEARDVEQAIAICKVTVEAMNGSTCIVMRGHVTAVKYEGKVETVVDFVNYVKACAALYDERAKMDDTSHMQLWHKESAALLREYLAWAEQRR